MIKFKKVAAVFTAAAFFSAQCGFTVLGGEVKNIDSTITKTGTLLTKTVKEPQIGTIGGEWTVLGLARGGITVPENYYENYYKKVEKELIKNEGVLHENKYTEYSRVALALTAIGKNPRNVGGYDMFKPLHDFDKTVWQGINGPIWAIIAADSGNYNLDKEIKQKYIDHIISKQMGDGGFALNDGLSTSDPDTTAMVIQAFAKYQSQPQVKKATDKALIYLSNTQNDDGGYTSWKGANSESTCQVLIALCEMGISVEDTRFVKNGNTVLDNLLSYQDTNGGFKHLKTDKEYNLMATEQALYAMVDYSRVNIGKTSLYTMTDIKKTNTTENKTPTDSKTIAKKQDILYPGKTFTDISADKGKVAIDALAQRGILSGKSENLFFPEGQLTRAEFAVMAVKALGLTPISKGTFTDVGTDKWYSDYVDTAYEYGIISGVGENIFDPLALITKEEAASMVARSAKLCGQNIAVDKVQTKNIIAQFEDYQKTSEWARESLAYCYGSNILSQEDLYIYPKKPVKKYEVAQMLYNMLKVSDLI